ncbi:MAG: Type 4 prepilin-like proteins leader peptide-processing enzyme [Legionellaceae bacterium]
MTIEQFLTTYPYFFLILIAFLSLCMGSFLNVIIYRLPIQLENEWHKACHDYVNAKDALPISSDTKNLRSYCPQCKKVLRIRDNIPIFSYLFLKGKCAHCKTPISLQYPLIEILCTLTSVIIAWHFGISLQTLAGLFFTWLLIIQSSIDFKHQLLPDVLTYIGIWVGLLFSINSLFTDSHSAIIGGIVAYLTLWTMAKLFKLVTHKEGMGYGDFKLYAMLGTWLGWQSLIFILFLATFSGLLIGIISIFLKKTTKETPIPFGPFLAFAGWTTLLVGNNINILN